MKLADVKLAIQEYGASAGMRAVMLFLSSDAEEKTPVEVMEALRQTLATEMYEDLLQGKLHLVFKGTDVDAATEENRKAIMAFLAEGLSDASLDFQVKTLKLGTHQLRPPFLELHTKGSVFTSQEMFYENFNYVVCDVPSLDDVEQPFALVEISKHAFSTFIFRVTSEDDWSKIKDNFIDPQYVTQQRARLFLIPPEGTYEAMAEATDVCAKIALEQGVRCGAHLGALLTTE